MQQLNYFSEIFVLGGIASALIIALDLRFCRQPMRIMNSVWVLTGLWASILGLWAYYAFGRASRCRQGTPAQRHAEQRRKRQRTHTMQMEKPMQEEMEMQMEMPKEGEMVMEMQMPPHPRWQSVVLSTLHCGAGCTLADLAGEWFLYFVPIAIGGSLLAGAWVLDYILALVFGIGFQYAAIRSMERISTREALTRAAKADILSLTAWQAGMYGWMAFVIFGLGDGIPLPRTSFTFWFSMQIAMACGFVVALPVNVLLIKSGIKKGM